MPIVLDGTNGITTPDVESTGPIIGTTGTFSGNITANGVATELRPLVLMTAQNSTSGTNIDFTGIPSWARRITVMLSGTSTSGASLLLVQVGSSAGFVTTGYVNAVSEVFNTGGTGGGNASTAGFPIASTVATNAVYGTVSIYLQSGLVYVASGVGSTNNASAWYTGGGITLPGVLDRLRITTANGTDTFDAGTINVMYE